ncbi:cytochrome P450 [Paracerasibacillus soli]|uniref:Cytochrome P450 n=1 Tax=Paracerasibacillus soli TaxID=480284 RepID=A0ABU5CXY8_9BACI|nr:cytochrome P450 [Virgibacillus soli]MDY0410288.1 cytochrome P450 [Virgibacillus soli]
MGGVPLAKHEVNMRSQQLASLFKSAAAVGPRHWRGRRSRNQLEMWLVTMVEQIRNHQLIVDEEKPLYHIVWHKDLDGNLLNPRVAAVEVINLLRPIVAISVYITFSAHALYHFPREEENVSSGEEGYMELFVQEVRRFYPFFPYAVARVREDFLWSGHDFKKGNLVLLDIYGTNRHPDLWLRPNEFDPSRFENWQGGLFDLIPQGGGNFIKDHRCPGEWLTIEVMKVSLNMLVNKMDYKVPKQNLQYSLVKIPSIPKSGFIMRHVRKK